MKNLSIFALAMCMALLVGCDQTETGLPGVDTTWEASIVEMYVVHSTSTVHVRFYASVRGGCYPEDELQCSDNCFGQPVLKCSATSVDDKRAFHFRIVDNLTGDECLVDVAGLDLRGPCWTDGQFVITTDTDTANYNWTWAVYGISQYPQPAPA